jgi:hypothetical protein
MDGGSVEPPVVEISFGLVDLRFYRAVVQLHRLGPRVLAELLAEIGARYLIRQPIEARVDEYLDRVDPVTLAAVDGDRLPPSPRLVR